MNAKDIAKEMVAKYQNLLKPHVMISDNLSKECALITVNEIMKQNSFPTMDWWEEVKKEIEKL